MKWGEQGQCGCGFTAHKYKFIEHVNKRRAKHPECSPSSATLARYSLHQAKCGYVSTSWVGIGSHVVRCKDPQCVADRDNVKAQTRRNAQASKNQYKKTKTRQGKKTKVVEAATRFNAGFQKVLEGVLAGRVKWGPNCLHRLEYAADKQAFHEKWLYELRFRPLTCQTVKTCLGAVASDREAVKKEAMRFMKLFHSDKAGTDTESTDMARIAGNLINAYKGSNWQCLSFVDGCVGIGGEWVRCDVSQLVAWGKDKGEVLDAMRYTLIDAKETERSAKWL